MDPLEPLHPAVLPLLRRHQLLRPLLKAMVQAEHLGPIALSEEQRDQALAGFRQQQGLETAAQLETWSQARGLAPEDLRWQVELPLRRRIHCLEHYRPKAEARFLERKNQLDQVVYSMLRLQDAGLCQELFLRVESGEASFDDLASQYAQGPERNTKGIVGPAPLSQPHPSLAERLRTGTPGLVMEPFRIGDWWLLVRLERLIPASFNEELALRLSQELLEEYLEQEVTDRMRDLLADSHLGDPA